MSQNRLSNIAQNLAQELVNSGQKTFQETLTVTQDKRDTGERIVVTVVRTTVTRSRRVEEAVKMVTLPAGEDCPCCGGTGRV